MRISAKTDYALRAAIELAALSSADPVKGEAIATAQGIPLRFLENILGDLRNAGIVESRRGVDGGYLLARPADSLTVGEVLRSIEGTQQARTRARRKTESPFDDMWQRVDQAVSDVIDKTTFGELVRGWSDKQNRFVLNWEI